MLDVYTMSNRSYRYSFFIKQQQKRCRYIVWYQVFHPTFYIFTPWLLDQFIRVPYQLHGEHTVLQPVRRNKLIIHIAISAVPGTDFHLSQVKHVRVKCLAQGQNIETMSQYWEGGKHDISLKILHQARFETARQAATLTKLRGLTIASCPALKTKGHMSH